MSDVAAALDRLLDRWLSHYHASDAGLPLLALDESWTSSCIDRTSTQLVDGVEHVKWQPHLNETPGSFDNIEQALELTLHQDIKTFYTHLVSADLDVKHEKGPLSLLQIFNQDDFDTLQQNLIGHIMMKRQLKQRVTVFFAVTDEEDQMLSLINETGEIWLESVGNDPHIKLADNMADFIDQLVL